MLVGRVQTLLVNTTLLEIFKVFESLQVMDIVVFVPLGAYDLTLSLYHPRTLKYCMSIMHFYNWFD